MTIALTQPVTPEEARGFLAEGHWTDRMSDHIAYLGAGGERLALIDRYRSLTYAQLAQEARRVASGLRRRGVASGDPVVVVTDNDCDSVVACHAIWGVGAVAVPVHRSSGPGDVAFACRTTRPPLALLASGAAGLGDAAAETGVALTSIDEVAVDTPDELTAEVDPDAPRLVVFTSGTTTSPKGVVHTANTLRAASANFGWMVDFTPDDRFFLISPLASIAGVLQVLEMAPELGASAVLENDWDEARTLELLVETGSTFYGGTDNLLARLLAVAHSRGVRVPLRAVAVGGTMLQRPVLDEAEDRFGIRVMRVYGSSEAPNSTGARPVEDREVRLADDGAPAPGVEVRTAGGTQEILIRGPHLFRGYLDPADNSDGFDGGWFRTGDAGELFDGRLRVVGRLKEVASRSGRKISLAEVEEAFAAVAPVESCTAFSVADDVTGERVALAVQIADGQSIDVPVALEAMVDAGLVRWKLPESVVHYTEPMPMTSTGKVRRRDLSEEAGTLLWRASRLEQAG